MDNIRNFVTPGLWLLLVVVWGLGALNRKETQQSESTASRLLHLGLMLLSFLFTLGPWFDFGPLGYRFTPSGPGAVIVGCLIQAVGLVFAIVARTRLGRNWSGQITIKEEHQLIRQGPYALVRHPIYTGWWFGLIGTAIVYGRWGGLLGCAIMLAAYWRKIGIEERFLVQQFGDAYEVYRRQVKALIPFVL